MKLIAEYKDDEINTVIIECKNSNYPTYDVCRKLIDKFKEIIKDTKHWNIKFKQN